MLRHRHAGDHGSNGENKQHTCHCEDSPPIWATSSKKEDHRNNYQDHRTSELNNPGEMKQVILSVHSEVVVEVDGPFRERPNGSRACRRHPDRQSQLRPSTLPLVHLLSVLH
jgi:hypothetical protein